MVDKAASPKHVALVVPCAALAICTTLFLLSGIRICWDAKPSTELTSQFVDVARGAPTAYAASKATKHVDSSRVDALYRSTREATVTSEKGAPCPTFLDEGDVRRGKVVVAVGDRFCVPASSTRPVVVRLTRGRQHEAETHQSIEEYLDGTSIESSRDRRKRADAVITLGLFVGDFLPHLSKLMAKRNGRVYGFEPNPHNFAFARGTIYENNLENVYAMNAAAGSCRDGGVETVSAPKGFEDGSVVDFCTATADGPCGGRCGFDTKNCTETTTIPIVCLDRVLTEGDSKVRVLHLDVEGAERIVLSGARRILKDFPLVILESMETEAAMVNLEASKRYLSKAGYNVSNPEKRNHNFLFYPPKTLPRS